MASRRHTRTDLDQLDAAQAVLALTPRSLSSAAGGLIILVLYLLVPLAPTARQVLGNVLLTGLPLAAAVACGVAGSRAPRDARLTWMLFAAAAVLVAAAQLTWIVEQWMAPDLPRFPGGSFLLFMLFHPVFAIGAVLALRWERDRQVATEAMLDGILVVLAGTVVVLRLVVEPLLDGTPPDADQLAAIVGVHVLAFASLFAATLMVVWRSPSISRQAATGFFLATLVFAVGNVLSAAGLDPDTTTPGDPFDLVWLAGWGIYLWAGLAGTEVAVPATPTARRRLVALVRNAIVPGLTLFLALAVIDLALNPPAGQLPVLLVGLVGAVLALRVGVALSAVAQQDRDEQRFTQAEILVQISHGLAGATNLDEILELISASTRDVLHAEAAGIELLSADGRTLETKKALGLPPAVLDMKFPVDDSFTGWVVQKGAPRATIDPSTDPFIQEKSLPFLAGSPLAAAPLRFGHRTFGALYAVRRRAFAGEDLELLEALAEQAATALENARLFEQVTALSLTDALTGLANRRQLERDIAREFAAARRGRPLVAVMFDLDGFKRYNDRYGHVAGDDALRAFADTLKVETRAMNLAARYGGDEFLVLLSDSEDAVARLFVERVAGRFRRESAALGHEPLDVTAGWASYTPDMEDWLQLIEAADRSLYRGKSSRSMT